jgi:DNA mismatch repair protein MutL
MDRRIKLLSEETINKIAAGEVIENPASVIKELFENACDAGAKRIVVEVEGGGFVLLKVSDEGCGMGPLDARACLQRHATSKIQRADDLFLLQTMGFRGEALASIAAVSKLQMTTALEGSEGVSLCVEAGEILSEAPSWRARGTCIEVRSLFYNVPARKKFQKGQAASQAEITRMVTLLALAHPQISVQLIAQKREIFSLSAAPLQQRVRELLGEAFEKTHAFAHEGKGWKAEGLLVGPESSRMNRSGQYLFVNQRPVTCLPLLFAVRDAYATRLSTDRHPLFLLHVTIDPALIDVNVHPQKKEIRLQDEASLKQGLRSAVGQTLGEGRSYAMPSIQMPHSFSFSTQAASFPLRLEERPLCVEEELVSIGLYEKWLLLDGKSLPQIGVEGILFIDLSYLEVDLFKHSLTKEKRLQTLLLPFTFSCSKAESDHLAQKLDELKELGVQMRPLSQTSFIIDALSSHLEERDAATIVEELLLEQTPADALFRAVRKRKKRYALHEAVHLFKQLLKTEDPCYLLGKAIYPLKRDEIENRCVKSEVKTSSRADAADGRR